MNMNRNTKTFGMKDDRQTARSVLECGSPLPLLTRDKDSVAMQSAGGLAPSKTCRLALLLCLCFLFSVFSFRAWGQSYSIDSYKISGGGGTSTGGPMIGTN